MAPLRLAEISRLRQTPGRSLLLYLTDRCPVGCAHCSVDSRPESPTVVDFDLLDALLDGICARPELMLVGISGGEPFVARRALTRAVERLAEAGKELVLYTSGVWAAEPVPSWVRAVLRRSRTVFLSTDAFHAAAVDRARYVRAARAIAAEGAWIVVQVLDLPEMTRAASELLAAAFGESVARHAELSPVPPLAYGRGAALFAPGPRRPGRTFGACGALGNPVVRYDGQVTACCNERVIVGHGPGRLRRSCRSAAALGEALDAFAADPLLHGVVRLGAGALTEHPRFAALADRPFSSVCELCWAMQARADPLGDRSDPLLVALPALLPGGSLC